MSVGCRRNAAVLGSLLLLSSLGFGAWTQLTLGVQADLRAVHFPTGTQVGYAVGVGPDSFGGFGGIVVKTIDGGANWTAKSVGGMNVLNSVYFNDNDNGYIVGDQVTALRTTDGGATWTPMTVPGSGDNLTKVQFPENGQVGYIGVQPQGGQGKILKTTDGGANWTSINVGGPLATSYSCGMANDNQGVVFGPLGMMAGSTDGFATSTAQGPNTIANMVAAAFSPTDPNRGYLVGNDTARGLGVIRFTATFGPVWDTVRCWIVPAFYGVDMPATDVAYVCGANGMILRSVADKDFFRTTVPTGFTNPMYGLCFPVGIDTGYAVGGGAAVLRTYDGGIQLLPGVADGKVPAMTRAGIRVLSNPCRHGIALHSDANVNVVVFDAAGRAVMRQAAAKGTSFLPLSAGAYFVKAGAQTTRAVVTD